MSDTWPDAFPGTAYEEAHAYFDGTCLRVVFETRTPDRIERRSVRLTNPDAARELAAQIAAAAAEMR